MVKSNEDLRALAELEKKRNTDHDFPPHYMWAENNNDSVRQSFDTANKRFSELTTRQNFYGNFSSNSS